MELAPEDALKLRDATMELERASHSRIVGQLNKELEQEREARRRAERRNSELYDQVSELEGRLDQLATECGVEVLDRYEAMLRGETNHT